jgi:glycosyltransferase involved in cell wall biosynthesis
MKILYDYQIFQFQRFGGISKYFTEIITELPAKVKYKISIQLFENVHLKESALLPPHKTNLITRERYFSKYNFRGKWRLYDFLHEKFPQKFNEYRSLNRDCSVFELKKQKFDIFHPTYYDPYFLEYIGSKPFVLTVHDMIHEKFAHLFANDLTAKPTIENKKKTILAAAHIIAVSENTKNDIIEHYGVADSKISVVYHASSLIKSIHTTLQLPSHYILYVGTRYLYKNFNTFIHAVKNILIEKNIKLLCVGAPFNNEENTLLQELGISEYCIQLFVDDNELYKVYANALFFAFPSLYEGFGIPILEAFDAGCPALISNTSCFPEIAGDAAAYFNPYDIADIESAVRRLTENETERMELITKGTERIKTFSWKNSAKQTVEVYKKVLNVIK